jgi:Na+/H+ antiporter NhaD/arsenite permease-like protein
MILGGLPFLQLDRAGVALLGAIAMISFDAVTLEEAAEAVHLPTIILLFSFMGRRLAGGIRVRALAA